MRTVAKASPPGSVKRDVSPSGSSMRCYQQQHGNRASTPEVDEGDDSSSSSDDNLDDDDDPKKCPRGVTQSRRFFAQVFAVLVFCSSVFLCYFRTLRTAEHRQHVLHELSTSGPEQLVRKSQTVS